MFCFSIMITIKQNRTITKHTDNYIYLSTFETQFNLAINPDVLNRRNIALKC